MIPAENDSPESSTLSSSTERAKAWKVLTVRSACVYLLLQPVEHLVSGFVGEGEGEDVFRFHPLADEVEDLFCDDSGLT